MQDYLILLFNMPNFTHFIQQYGYIGILIWFLTFDQITPIPEEISLLLVGYLCAHDIFNPFLAGATCLVGVVAVDTAYFFLSKTGSNLVKKKSNKKGPSFKDKYKEKLKDHMPRTLLVLNFIPRMRMWGPILVGSMRLPFKKFLLYDSIGLAVHTALYITLGYIFNQSISSLMGKMKGWQHIIVIVAVIILSIIVVLIIRKVHQQKNAAQPD